jgi:hypothetical protein
MTARSWNDGASADFFSPFAWTPFGLPQAGDTLAIGDGNPTASSNAALDGYAILLGGTIGTPGPAQTAVYTDRTHDVRSAARSPLPRLPIPH